jgi:hypothetical protein
MCWLMTLLASAALLGFQLPVSPKSEPCLPKNFCRFLGVCPSTLLAVAAPLAAWGDPDVGSACAAGNPGCVRWLAEAWSRTFSAGAASKTQTRVFVCTLGCAEATLARQSTDAMHASATHARARRRTRTTRAVARPGTLSSLAVFLVGSERREAHSFGPRLFLPPQTEWISRRSCSRSWK